MWFARTSPIQMWINWKCNDFPIDFIQIGRLLLCVFIKGGFFFIRLFFTAHYFIFHICNAVLLITFDLIMLCPIAIISIQSIDINSQMNSIRKKTINRWFKYAQISWFLQYHISCRSHWNDSLLIKRFRLNKSVARRAQIQLIWNDQSLNGFRMSRLFYRKTRY